MREKESEREEEEIMRRRGEKVRGSEREKRK